MWSVDLGPPIWGEDRRVGGGWMKRVRGEERLWDREAGSDVGKTGRFRETQGRWM